MDDLIDLLRNKTIMSRFSRGEIRDFLDRLEVEGYVIAPLPKPNQSEPTIKEKLWEPKELGEGRGWIVPDAD